MRFVFMADAQEGLSYARMLELAQAAEAAGFEAFVRSDHWLCREAESRDRFAAHGDFEGPERTAENGAR